MLYLVARAIKYLINFLEIKGIMKARYWWTLAIYLSMNTFLIYCYSYEKDLLTPKFAALVNKLAACSPAENELFRI